MLVSGVNISILIGHSTNHIPTIYQPYTNHKQTIRVSHFRRVTCVKPADFSRGDPPPQGCGRRQGRDGLDLDPWKLREPGGDSCDR